MMPQVQSASGEFGEGRLGGPFNSSENGSEELANHPEPGSGIPAVDSDGSTRSHRAVQSSNEEVVTPLLSNGADMSVENNEHNTLMDTAVSTNNTNTIESLDQQIVNNSFAANDVLSRESEVPQNCIRINYTKSTSMIYRKAPTDTTENIDQTKKKMKYCLESLKKSNTQKIEHLSKKEATVLIYFLSILVSKDSSDQNFDDNIKRYENIIADLKKNPFNIWLEESADEPELPLAGVTEYIESFTNNSTMDRRNDEKLSNEQAYVLIYFREAFALEGFDIKQIGQRIKNHELFKTILDRPTVAEKFNEFIDKTMKSFFEKLQKSLQHLYEQANIFIYFVEAFALEGSGDPAVRDEMKRYFSTCYSDWDVVIISAARSGLLKCADRKVRLEDVHEFMEHGDTESFFTHLQQYLEHVESGLQMLDAIPATPVNEDVKQLKAAMKRYAKDVSAEYKSEVETQDKYKRQVLEGQIAILNRYKKLKFPNGFDKVFINDEMERMIKKFISSHFRGEDGIRIRDALEDGEQLEQFIAKVKQNQVPSTPKPLKEFMKKFTKKKILGIEIEKSDDQPSFLIGQLKKLSKIACAPEEVTQEDLFNFIVVYSVLKKKSVIGDIPELGSLRNQLLHQFDKLGCVEFADEVSRLRYKLFRYPYVLEVRDELDAYAKNPGAPNANKVLERLKKRFKSLNDDGKNCKTEHVLSEMEAIHKCEYKVVEPSLSMKDEDLEICVFRYLWFTILMSNSNPNKDNSIPPSINSSDGSPISNKRRRISKSPWIMDDLHERKMFDQFFKLEECRKSDTKRHEEEMKKFRTKALVDYGVLNDHFDEIYQSFTEFNAKPVDDPWIMDDLHERKMFDQFFKLEECRKTDTKRHEEEMKEFRTKAIDDYGVLDDHFDEIYQSFTGFNNKLVDDSVRKQFEDTSRSVSQFVNILKQIMDECKFTVREVIDEYERYVNGKCSHLSFKMFADATLSGKETIHLSINEKTYEISYFGNVVIETFKILYNPYHKYKKKLVTIEEMFKDQTFLDYLVDENTEDKNMKQSVDAYLKMAFMINSLEQAAKTCPNCSGKKIHHDIECISFKEQFEQFVRLQLLSEHLYSKTNKDFYDEKQQQFKTHLISRGCCEKPCSEVERCFDELYRSFIEPDCEFGHQKVIKKIECNIDKLQEKLKLLKLKNKDLFPEVYKSLTDQGSYAEFKSVWENDNRAKKILKTLEQLHNDLNNETEEEIHLGHRSCKIAVKDVLSGLLKALDGKFQLKDKSRTYILIKLLLKIDCTAPYIARLLTKVETDENICPEDLVRLVEILSKKDKSFIERLNELLCIKSSKFDLYEELCKQMLKHDLDIESMRLIFNYLQHVAGIFAALDRRTKVINTSQETLEKTVAPIEAIPQSLHNKVSELSERGYKGKALLILDWESEILSTVENVANSDRNVSAHVSRNDEALMELGHLNEAQQVSSELPMIISLKISQQRLLATSDTAQISTANCDYDKAHGEWNTLVKILKKFVHVSEGDESQMLQAHNEKRYLVTYFLVKIMTLAGKTNKNPNNESSLYQVSLQLTFAMLAEQQKVLKNIMNASYLGYLNNLRNILRNMEAILSHNAIAKLSHQRERDQSSAARRIYKRIIGLRKTYGLYTLTVNDEALTL